MGPLQVLAWVAGLTIAWVVALLVVEWITLADDVPDNHLTAVLRTFAKKLPWPFILLAFVSGFLAGHCFGN